MLILGYKVGMEPEKVEINNQLREFQKFVGGYIEIFPLTETPYLCICNEEGKYNGLAPNRVILHNGTVLDVIAGDFLICRAEGEEFQGLTDEDISVILESGMIGGIV